MGTFNTTIFLHKHHFEGKNTLAPIPRDEKSPLNQVNETVHDIGFSDISKGGSVRTNSTEINEDNSETPTRTSNERQEIKALWVAEQDKVAFGLHSCSTVVLELVRTLCCGAGR